MRKKYMMVIMSLFIGWHCLAQGERGNICSLMDAPDTTGIWLQPAQTVNAYPKWGHVMVYKLVCGQHPDRAD